jgi:hypothetical protein
MPMQKKENKIFTTASSKSDPAAISARTSYILYYIHKDPVTIHVIDVKTQMKQKRKKDNTTNPKPSGGQGHCEFSYS